MTTFDLGNIENVQKLLPNVTKDDIDNGLVIAAQAGNRF